MVNLLLDPFIDYGFMRRAMIACLALSIGATPMGSFLLLRRMSLIGDALSHAILPGVAIGYFFFGMSIIAMSIGGFIAGLVVFIFSGWISSKTPLKEDASFAGFYLGSLAFGVMLMSIRGSNLDLLHLLFGSLFTIDLYAIKFIGIVTSITFFMLAFFYRALVIESFDPSFLKYISSGYHIFVQVIFLSLVVLNLIAGFQVLGTLMSVGLMMLPALTARCLTTNLLHMLILSVFISLFCSWVGLLGAFYISIPAGPAIILCASITFLFSILLSRYSSIYLVVKKRILYHLFKNKV